jgi:hypothetical protein
MVLWAFVFRDWYIWRLLLFMPVTDTTGLRIVLVTAFDELAKDVNAGADAISRFSEADWWSWKRGSALFFWHWPEGEPRQSARDGMPIWIKSKLPRYQLSGWLHLLLEKL